MPSFLLNDFPPATEQTISNNNYITAFYNAYINHGDVVFDPADMLVFLAMNFSIFIDKNVEEIEHKIEVKKVFPNPIDDDELLHDAEPEPIDEISCATADHRIAYRIAMRSADSKINKYSFHVRCGIRTVNVRGTIDDWRLVKSTVQTMHKTEVFNYATSQYNWEHYVDRVVDILDKIIESYHTPDRTWFNKMVDKDLEYGFYGDSTDHITGWIIDLVYGKESGCIVQEIPEIISTFKYTYYGREVARTAYFKPVSEYSTYVELSELNISSEDIENLSVAYQAKRTLFVQIHREFCETGRTSRTDNITQIEYILDSIKNDESINLSEFLEDFTIGVKYNERSYADEYDVELIDEIIEEVENYLLNAGFEEGDLNINVLFELKDVLKLPGFSIEDYYKKTHQGSSNSSLYYSELYVTK